MFNMNHVKTITVSSLLLSWPLLSHAVCTISGNKTSTVDLNTICTLDNIVTLNVTMTPSISGDGVTGTSTPWFVTNQGSVSVTSGNGISLAKGGTITNSITGNISASSNGIVAHIATGSDPRSTINNYGHIVADINGLLLAGGGYVTNYANAVISGGFTGISFSDNITPVAQVRSYVENYGTISGNTSAIVFSYGGGLINHLGGLIDGGNSVIQMKNNPSLVENYGQIGTFENTNASIGMSDGGTVYNYATGKILAGGRGIDAGFITVYNQGEINSHQTNGIGMDSGGSITNYAGGTISGGQRGIRMSGGGVNAPGQVFNAGTIIGGTFTSVNAAAIEIGVLTAAPYSVVMNSGGIQGKVIFHNDHDVFSMTSGSMTGQLLMGNGGFETASFTNVTDSNIGGITQFNGGGGGFDNLIFINTSHTGGSDMVNWETISLDHSSILSLTSNLTLGGNFDSTALLNINASTLNANDTFNIIIQSNNSAQGLPVVVNNSGTINIASPNSNHSLTVKGNYSGQNGLLKVNAILNGDASPADKLIIDGQGNASHSASGSTAIAVHNTTGVGALTNSNGILVVEAIGKATTTPSSFSLDGPLRVGAYDYRLFQGGLNPSDPEFSYDWFLRSTFIPTPVPPTPDNLLPIIGPELSVYSSTMPTTLELNRLTLGTWHERTGNEAQFKNLNTQQSNALRINGGWMRVFNQSYNENFTVIVDPKISAKISGVQAGLDLYQKTSPENQRQVAGMYIAYAHAHQNVTGPVTNLDSTAYITRHTGSMNQDANSGGLYWTFTAPSGAYIDLVAQGSFYKGNATSYRTSMPLKGTGNTESIETGYPLHYSTQWVFEPEAQLLYDYATFKDVYDVFSKVSLGKTHALIGRIGFRLLHEMELKNRAVTPYLRANLWSILSGDRANTVIYAGADNILSTVTNNWVQLGGGVNVDVSHQVSVYAFVDDIVSVKHRQNKLTGFDAGLGIHAYWG